MTDEERFLEVLSETWDLLLQLGDLKTRVVVIGGQVLALHSLARTASAAIQTATGTGVAVTRGFTHEPDLLVDLQPGDFSGGRLSEVLKDRGYKWMSGYRWGRTLPSGTDMQIDFFRSPELPEEEAPIAMHPLVDAEEVLRRTETIAVRVGARTTEWVVPDALGFLTMKLRAKLEQRPKKTKDCFDMFVFVKMLGVDAVNASLRRAPDRGVALRRQLSALFWSTDSSGVLDVLTEAGLTETLDRELLAREVVDLFAELAAG